MPIYKALIQPVIDYCPFITLSINKALVQKMEMIQNKSIRYVTKWPKKLSNQNMINSLKIGTILDRHKSLSNRYIKRAYQNNPIIKQYIKGYKKPRRVIDGYYNHNRNNKRDTVMSRILGYRQNSK